MTRKASRRKRRSRTPSPPPPRRATTASRAPRKSSSWARSTRCGACTAKPRRRPGTTSTRTRFSSRRRLNTMPTTPRSFPPRTTLCGARSSPRSSLCSPPRTARLSRRATGGWARCLSRWTPPRAAARFAPWGTSGATPRRTWRALTSHSGSRQVMTGTGTPASVSVPSRSRAATSPPRLSPRRARGRAPGCAAVRGDGDTVPARARSPAPAPCASLGADASAEPLEELRRQGLAEERGALCGGAPAYAYDPAWVLPFALAGLRRGSLEARDAARWGLAGVAFAASASADETTRAVAFATLDALREACDETQRPEAADFRERAQLAALLAATRNGLAPEGAADGEAVLGAAQARKRRCDDDEVLAAGLSRPTDANKDKDGSDQTSTDSGVSDIARLPTATAVFAAEAATAALHPAGDAYVITQRAVHRRAALDGEALPVNFLGALNGSGGGGGGDRAENAAIISASRGRPARSASGCSGCSSPACAEGRRTRGCSARRSPRRCSCRTEPPPSPATLTPGKPRSPSSRAPPLRPPPRARSSRGAGCWRGWRPPRAPPAAPQRRAPAAAARARRRRRPQPPRSPSWRRPRGRSTAAQRAPPPTSSLPRGTCAPRSPRSFRGATRGTRATRARSRRVARRCSPRCVCTPPWRAK